MSPHNHNNTIGKSTVTIPKPVNLNNLDASPLSSDLEKVLKTQEVLKEAKSKKITFSEPVLSQAGRPIIFPNTINVIQGQAGVHKSRLAETICSAFLKKPDSDLELLDFRINEKELFAVCYVDTERNIKEQFPFALQNILIKAGYSIEENPEHLYYISLIEVQRDSRLKTLGDYLENLRKRGKKHILIVLDVITDCITDFNNTDESMELVDLMNVYINQHDVTFLCLIHENPNQHKARGHLGTEIMNKASTVLQISLVGTNERTEDPLIKIKFLKCRNSQKFEPFYARYCTQTKGLVLAQIQEATQNGTQKVSIEPLIDSLEIRLRDAPMKSAELLALLEKEFGAGERTIRDTLKQVIAGKMELMNDKGEYCTLLKEKVGKEVVYKLTPIG